MRSHTALLAVLLASVGCYRGFDVEDKQPPPGYPGGSCLVGSGCNQGAQCLAEAQVCIDPLDPCKGIYCGGNGSCSFDLDTNAPFCACDPGFTNESFAFFCTPGR
ncbi:hypothetical protein [Enhygromyxa salina]|uniref:EGF-like domain-containing protein n=1 Tax=Enhygromyxa salina TaxID=215803 RepID=A0A2S9XL78_9BACT|nr:hypothetical protein [Enhygromyxa salina]PRP93636.1 hypothetical protein ENSA7_80640 [Enhygromyxa salina]